MTSRGSHDGRWQVQVIWRSSDARDYAHLYPARATRDEAVRDLADAEVSFWPDGARVVLLSPSGTAQLQRPHKQPAPVSVQDELVPF